jgi:glycerol-3-phosphate dehydrogenase
MIPEARAFAGDGIRPWPRSTRTRELPPEGGTPAAAAEEAPGAVQPAGAVPPAGAVLPAATTVEAEPATPAVVEAFALAQGRPAHAPGPPRHVVIVGGGGTGAAIAHDLALRGLRVTLVERGEITSGSTGRGMGLLHSGARYATTDRVAAADCVAENKILRRIAPGSFEENDGLIVALSDEEAELEQRFLDACWQSAVPVRQIPRSRVLGIEPRLSPAVRLAIQVADATMDPMRLALRFLATARANGAQVRTFTEVTGLAMDGQTLHGIRVRDHAAGTEEEIGADLVVNAAGPWAGGIAAMAGVTLPVELEAGTMVAFRGRHSNTVIGRLRDVRDGDLAVPMRQQTVFGAMWRPTDVVDDPRAPEGSLDALVEGAVMLLPAIRDAKVRATWTSVRPVFAGEAGLVEGLSTDTRCFDHALDPNPIDGLVTVAGGNATLMRRVAEAAADVVCGRLGFACHCETAEIPLLPHTDWYAR